MNWGGPGYPTYEVVMKVSDAEKKAQAQSAAEATQLQNMMNVQFKESQDLLNKILIPQLTQMATNPEGFGAKAIADMQSKLIATVGTNFASQEKSLQAKFSSENLPGLTSGAQEAILANLGGEAASAEAGGLTDIAIANEQQKVQEREFGVTGLEQASTLLNEAPGTASPAVAANANSFNDAYKMASQGSIFKNLLGGVIGAGLNFATGGAANLDTTGGSTTGEQFQNFLQGGQTALAGG